MRFPSTRSDEAENRCKPVQIQENPGPKRDGEMELEFKLRCGSGADQESKNVENEWRKEYA
jgi:hypothetical protein